MESAEERIRNSLKDLNFPRQEMYECGAVIAGGYVLSKILDEDWNNDIDIYIQADNPVDMQMKCKSFVGKLIHSVIGTNRVYHGTKTDRIYSNVGLFECRFPAITVDTGELLSKVTPAYDNSFMRKNNILSRECFKGIDKHGNEISIDIMLVKGNVIDVIENFDLDVCKVWYDGKKMHTKGSRILRNIQNKIATLGSDYVVKLNEGNLFTKFRLRKYMDRGFEIRLERTPAQPPVPDPISWEKWAIIRAYNFLATQTRQSFNSEFSWGLRPANIPLSMFVLNFPLLIEDEEYFFTLLEQINKSLVFSELHWKRLRYKLRKFANVLYSQPAKNSIRELVKKITNHFETPESISPENEQELVGRRRQWWRRLRDRQSAVSGRPDSGSAREKIRQEMEGERQELWDELEEVDRQIEDYESPPLVRSGLENYDSGESLEPRQINFEPESDSEQPRGGIGDISGLNFTTGEVVFDEEFPTEFQTPEATVPSLMHSPEITEELELPPAAEAPWWRWYAVLENPIMGLYYFWNSETGETTWDSPNVEGNIPEAPRHAAPDPPPF